MLLRTWLKYSSAIRLAHSTQYFNGRVGFDTSAHLIIILFTNIMFSGSIAADISKSWEPCTQIFRENVYKDSNRGNFVIDLFKKKSQDSFVNLKIIIYNKYRKKYKNNHYFDIHLWNPCAEGIHKLREMFKMFRHLGG